MHEKLVLNQNLIVNEINDRVELQLNERRVSVVISKKAFYYLNKLIMQNITWDEVQHFKSQEMFVFLDPLYFNDIIISEHNDDLYQFGILHNPARMNIISKSIPDRKIDNWCFFGAPVDFAMDPPRSPVHGPYIYRKLGESHQFMRDLGDVAYVNTDNIYSFGEKIRYVTRLIQEKENRAMMIGGDHSLTYFTLKEISRHVDNILLIQFDAHSDINTSKSKINNILYHANFISKIVEEKVVCGVIQIGVREHTTRYDRSYLDEFSIFQINCEINKKKEGLLKDLIKKRNVYISFDPDALDPTIFPHVTTPMDNGMTESYVMRIIDIIKASRCNIIGADMMEFTGGFDEKGQLFNREIPLLDKIIKYIIN